MESLVRGLDCKLRKQELAAEIAYGCWSGSVRGMRHDGFPTGERAMAERE
jgi:hypothetical protein